MSARDKTILRDLATEYAEVAAKEVQRERRDLWRRHNSFKRTHPLIYIRAFAWGEMPQSKCECEDGFFRHYESSFRQAIFRDTFNDDFIIEPWVTLRATCVTPPGGIWGLPVRWTRSKTPRGSGVWDAPIKEPGDIEKLARPHHVIDEADTARNLAKLQDAIGDILTITVDRGPAYQVWNADISTQIASIRGLEQVMWDMIDWPEWLHHLLSRMRDGILQAQAEAEKAGDWTLCNHENQAMTYAEELADPAPNSPGVTRDKLWCFCASQETTGVGPDMFYEFMLQYQIPIMANFGLAAYGCCEDLTHKIRVLRRIPNLRRIAVAPAANVAKCAEQIGQDYILSYRPSPTDMVGYGFDPARIRRILRRDLQACNGCHVDITLKDVETVQGDPDRIRKWVQIVREETAALGMTD
jgi:hypothetical protein